jgi:two-component system, OmpR family, sensor histidine kinase CreC
MHQADVSAPREIPRKWRPSLGMIVFAVLAFVLALPLLGLLLLGRFPDRLALWAGGSTAEYLVLAAGVVGMTGIIGYVFWRTITRPIHALVRSTRALGLGERDAASLPIQHGTRELAALSQSFLEMATRLHDRTDYITTFAAHVSHELKSPLSSIRGAAELLLESGEEMSPGQRRKFLDNIVGDTERLTALLARLRELARADNPQIGQSTLDEVVATVRASVAGIAIVAEGDLARPVRMSAENAAIVVAHLADNALRHKARTLRIAAKPEGERLRLTVANDGEPIADNNREKIFTPFFTTRREAGGTGMGLEIVRSMLRAHGGEIRLAAADPVAFEIEIPLA